MLTRKATIPEYSEKLKKHIENFQRRIRSIRSRLAEIEHESKLGLNERKLLHEIRDYSDVATKSLPLLFPCSLNPAIVYAFFQESVQETIRTVSGMDCAGAVASILALTSASKINRRISDGVNYEVIARASDLLANKDKPSQLKEISQKTVDAFSPSAVPRYLSQEEEQEAYRLEDRLIETIRRYSQKIK